MEQKTETSALAKPLLARKVTMPIEARQLVYGLVIVLLVTTIGMLLTLQGWKSRIPAFDMLTYFNGAEDLIKTGAPARYGDLSSYGSFKTPGTTWLMAPGMLVLHDPRLYEKLDSALLYLGTLLGVFLLARTVLGIWCAYLSVVVYGLSGLGLSFAGSLWPIGHPFFYVWIVYFAIQWATRKDAKYLAAATVTWALGMYVAMAITPAILVLPALWLFYRPPLFTRLHLLVAVLTLAVWYPYLQFETGRGFADLRSQLLREHVLPANYKEAWCDPNLPLKYVNSASTASLSDAAALPETQSSALNLLDRLMRRGGRVADGLLADLQQVTPVPGISALLLLLMLISLVTLSLTVLVPQTRIPKSWISRAIVPLKDVDRTKTASFVLSLAAPWLLLLMVAEPGRPERFFWLWPLQAIALVAFVTNVAPSVRLPGLTIWIGQMILIGALLIPALQSHLAPWLRDGWAGSDAKEVQVVDYVGNQLHADGRQQAAIGYQIFLYEFMPKYNILNRQYKVGAEFDFLFKHWDGIANTDQCAEGVSPNDEYRIVQTRRIGDESAPSELFDVPLAKGFHLLQSFDSYQVFKRN
jgi:hypothetical protein